MLRLPVRSFGWLAATALFAAFLIAVPTPGQEPNPAAGSQAQAGGNGAASRATASTDPALPGGAGGAPMADFESLIDLIQSTIQPTSWVDVGGPGSIEPFPTGVHVDSLGLLQPLLSEATAGKLAAVRKDSEYSENRKNREDAQSGAAQGRDARRASPLRKISLPRLEEQVQLRLAAGQPPTESMRVLAGLQRIEYVFVYPESGDVVLAGPAGNWRTDHENRIVAVETAQPVVRLDDLVVIFRHTIGQGDARFGCLITPRREGLARLQAFLAEPSRVFSRAAERAAWVDDLRASLGRQEIAVYGLDPRTRVARVIVEADYRMKLVGMGLEEGVPGVKSYLDLIEVKPGQSPPPMGVLRWWFTLDYEAVLATPDRNAFALRGRGVKVQSENELLAVSGQRVHTGRSEPLNRRFTESFTEHFEALREKYPIYTELRNVCDLAMVAALVREEHASGRTAWHPSCFGPSSTFPVALRAAPRTVDSVGNHRVLRSGRQIHTLAGVSGGVQIDPSALVARQAIEVERDSHLTGQRATAAAKNLSENAWWWD